MYCGRLVFPQVIDYLPILTFRRCVQRDSGNQKVKRVKCLDQYLSMAFRSRIYRNTFRTPYLLEDYLTPLA